MTDLDRLAALLAAIRADPLVGIASTERAGKALELLPSLLEAARREAALREALRELPRYTTRPFSDGGGAGPDPDGPWVSVNDIRALLHDNAGAAARAALPAEGTE